MQQANQPQHLKTLKKRYPNLSLSKVINQNRLNSNNFNSNNRCNNQMMQVIIGEELIHKL